MHNQFTERVSGRIRVNSGNQLNEFKITSSSFFGVSYSNDVVSASWTPGLTNWHYLVQTYASGGQTNATQLYLDGSPQTITGGSTNTANTSLANLSIGSLAGTGIFNSGYIDEFRISNVARAPSWIQTEYNNIYNPTAFETLGLS